MMDPLGSAPIWLIGAPVVVLATIVVLLLMRTQVNTHPEAVARGTRLVLICGALGVLLLSGWTGWQALSQQRRTVSASSSLAESRLPAEPTSAPTPTPSPRVSGTITQAVTTFCQAISTRDYQRAWGMYAVGLQQRHPRTAVVAAWSRYQQCSIPDQGGDPDAMTILTLTVAPGMTDQFGRTGATNERLTMEVQAQAWKITGSARCWQKAVFPYRGDKRWRLRRYSTVVLRVCLHDGD